MTAIKYMSSAQMKRETGMNALGYAQPKKSRILIRNGLSKSVEMDVRKHEFDHINKGEEGPFLGTLGAIAGGSLISGIMGKKAAKAGAAASNYATDQTIAEQRRQFDLNRGDTDPYRQVGANALNQYAANLGLPQYSQPQGDINQFQQPVGGPTNRGGQPSTPYNPMWEYNVGGNFSERRSREAERSGQPQQPQPQGPQGPQGPQQFSPQSTAGSELPQFNYSGQIPEFSYGGQQPQFDPSGAPPEFQGGQRFNYNMEQDPGYQFARDQALEATTRAAGASGKRNSGNVLAALQDRASGLASQYSNDIFNRQIGQSRENYGRDVGEYGLDYQREGDIRGRNVQDYGIAADREQRGYQRGLGEFDINRQRESEQYGRGLTGFGLDYQRAGDIYGRGENVQNRLAALSGVGQTAVSQSGASGSNMANQIGSALGANAVNQGNAAGLGYSSINNAVQGGISNLLAYNQGNRLNTQYPQGGGFNMNDPFAGQRPQLGYN